MSHPRIAVVTPANRGIGREVALQVSREHGFHVLLGARDLAKGREAAREIPNAKAIQLDVSDPVSGAHAFERIEADFGRLDVLLNNAGVDYDTDQRASTADLDRVRGAFDTNLFRGMGHGHRRRAASEKGGVRPHH